MARFCTRERGHWHHVGGAQAQLGCRDVAGSLLGRDPRALPGDEDAADAEQRSRVFAEDGKGRERPGGGGVVRGGIRAAAEFLGAKWNGSNAPFEARCGGEALDDLALPASGLDQVDASSWKGRREDQAREAGAGPQVDDASGRTQPLDCEPGEAVGDVQIQLLGGASDGGRRIRLRGESLKERLDSGSGARDIGDREAPDRGLDRFT